MKLPYRQTIEAILAISPDYRFSSMELMLLLHFVASLGDEIIDLGERKDTPRIVWKEILRCSDGDYITRLFSALGEKRVISNELVYQNKTPKAYRSLHPDFAEAIQKHA